MIQQQRIEYSPALSKFMAEAEAVGGWDSLKLSSGRIRNADWRCPGAVVCNGSAFCTAREVIQQMVRFGLSEDEAKAVVNAADNYRTPCPLTAQLRKDMESWVK
jgi:hypothetical protein